MRVRTNLRLMQITDGYRRAPLFLTERYVEVHNKELHVVGGFKLASQSLVREAFNNNSMAQELIVREGRIIVAKSDDSEEPMVLKVTKPGGRFLLEQDQQFSGGCRAALTGRNREERLRQMQRDGKKMRAWAFAKLLRMKIDEGNRRRSPES